MRKLIKGILFLALVVVIVLYASSAFDGDKVAPGRLDEPAGLEPPARTVSAERGTVPVFEEAVGTVESRKRVTVAAQVTARVLAVAAEAGETVRAGAPLVTLDDRELAARLAQAREALSAAEASRTRSVKSKARNDALLTQARARRKRILKLLEGSAATPEQMEEAEALFLQAQAGVEDAEAGIAAAEARIQQAKQVVAEAEVALGHTRILTPIDGVVSDRMVEPGDLASVGRTLLVVLDTKALRLEAQVREGLISSVREGETLEVQVPAARKSVRGQVAELIPSADPVSRTFRVRVDFAPVEGVHPGMFGRLRLPVGERQVVHIPAAAVVRVGQLETVLLQREGRWERRLVTTGISLEEDAVEVLSGLRGGETIGLPEAD
ncbi:MAG: efflux RND transporter periplasmic adaptor subunit [Planctomycetota bacterium]|jgi:multidrug efflux pump subunit AcrA (membrane-fusion protein)